jgi:hypothetical protein
MIEESGASQDVLCPQFDLAVKLGKPFFECLQFRRLRP